MNAPSSVTYAVRSVAVSAMSGLAGSALSPPYPPSLDSRLHDAVGFLTLAGNAGVPAQVCVRAHAWMDEG